MSSWPPEPSVSLVFRQAHGLSFERLASHRVVRGSGTCHNYRIRFKKKAIETVKEG